jgi:hypothetical protein
MKKTFTLLILMWITSMTVNSQVILDEIFNYSVTNLKDEVTWTTAWVTLPGIGTGRNIVTPALTYITMEGTYVLSDLGKTINSDYTSGASDYYSIKDFTATPVTSTVYLSFLYNPGVRQKQSQSEVFGFADGTSGGPKVYAGKALVTATSFRFGLTRGSGTSTDIKWTTTEYDDTAKIYLVVLKYDFTSATASLYINPTLASTSEPTADATDNISSTVRTQLKTLRFRVNGNNKANFNLSSARVSGSWNDAVAISSPTAVNDLTSGKNSFRIYPNPASGNVNINYLLTSNGIVKLDIYNLNNQIVKSFVNNEPHFAGNYSRSLDISGLAPGIYFARLTMGTTSKTQKLVVNR